jgi:hypothetical protein
LRKPDGSPRGGAAHKPFRLRLRNGEAGRDAGAQQLSDDLQVPITML